MKNTLIFLTILFAVVTLAIAQTNELPSDTDALKEKIESIEVSQKQINEQIISDQTAIANEIKNQQILIENMQKQILSDTDALKEIITTIKTSQQKTNGDIESLEKSLNIKINNHQEALGRLQEQLDELNNAIQKTNTLLQQNHNQIENEIATNEQATREQLLELDNSLSKNTRNWIIAVAAIALLSIILFLLLRLKLDKEKTGLTSQIQKTQKSLEEEAVKLDSKLIELLETQLKLITEKRETTLHKSEEADHSLAIKVADEIIRIQKNLSNMNPEIKGLKQLTASVKRIQDNFEANGYELVDMLGKRYDEGMKVSANFKPDENLKPGEQIITRIIKPQVNYNGVMIQAAQIEVSVNE